MIFAYALLTLVVASGPQDQRDKNIRFTQTSLEAYPFDGDVGLTYKGQYWDIMRAANAGRCRTSFILDEGQAVVIDWSSVTAFAPEKEAIKIVTKRLPEGVVFDLRATAEPKQFVEVFDYLRHACAGAG